VGAEQLQQLEEKLKQLEARLQRQAAAAAPAVGAEKLQQMEKRLKQLEKRLEDCAEDCRVRNQESGQSLEEKRQELTSMTEAYVEHYNEWTKRMEQLLKEELKKIQNETILWADRKQNILRHQIEDMDDRVKKWTSQHKTWVDENDRNIKEFLNLVDSRIRWLEGAVAKAAVNGEQQRRLEEQLKQLEEKLQQQAAAAAATEPRIRPQPTEPTAVEGRPRVQFDLTESQELKVEEDNQEVRARLERLGTSSQRYPRLPTPRSNPSPGVRVAPAAPAKPARLSFPVAATESSQQQDAWTEEWDARRIARREGNPNPPEVDTGVDGNKLTEEQKQTREIFFRDMDEFYQKNPDILRGMDKRKALEDAAAARQNSE
jgi:hypothetical protein